MKERLSVIGYTYHVMSPEVLAQKSKIQSEIPLDVPCGGNVKRPQKDNLKVPDIFFSAPVSPLNSAFYTGWGGEYC